jgi:hypothetical protein
MVSRSSERAPLLVNLVLQHRMHHRLISHVYEGIVYLIVRHKKSEIIMMYLSLHVISHLEQQNIQVYSGNVTFSVHFFQNYFSVIFRAFIIRSFASSKKLALFFAWFKFSHFSWSLYIVIEDWAPNLLELK